MLRPRSEGKQATGGRISAVHARQLYGRYHQAIGTLARTAGPNDDWRAELTGLVESFEADVEGLERDSGRLLREELCSQLEHEALAAPKPLARQVLLAAVKRLELP